MAIVAAAGDFRLP